MNVKRILIIRTKNYHKGLALQRLLGIEHLKDLKDFDDRPMKIKIRTKTMTLKI